MPSVNTKRTVLIVMAGLSAAASAALWGGLLAGKFRHETARTTGVVVRPGEYKFVLENEVFTGRLPESAVAGTTLQVFYDPSRPARHHASLDGRLPDLREDPGSRIPMVASVFLLALGAGFAVAAVKICRDGAVAK